MISARLACLVVLSWLPLIWIAAANGGQRDRAPEVIPVAELFDYAADLPEPRVSADGKSVAYYAIRAGHAALNIAPFGQVSSPILTFDDPNRCLTTFRWSPSGDFIIMLLRPACSFAPLSAATTGFTIVRLDLASGSIEAIAPPSRFKPTIHIGSAKPNTVLVTRDKRDPVASRALKIDLSVATLEEIALTSGSSDLAIDQSLRPVLALKRTPNGGMQLRVSALQGAWTNAGNYDIAERHAFRALGILDDGRAVNLIDTLGRNKAAVVRLDLATGERTFRSGSGGCAFRRRRQGAACGPGLWKPAHVDRPDRLDAQRIGSAFERRSRRSFDSCVL